MAIASWNWNWAACPLLSSALPDTARLDSALLDSLAGDNRLELIDRPGGQGGPQSASLAVKKRAREIPAFGRSNRRERGTPNPNPNPNRNPKHNHNPNCNRNRNRNRRAEAGGRPGRGRRAAVGWGGRGGQALGRGRERLLAAAGGPRRAARPGTGGAAGGSRLPGSDGGQRAPHGAAFFFFLELRCYLSEEVHLELYIDKSRGAKLQLATGHNTCLFIDRFPCSLLSDLSIDAMDITGEQQQDVEHKPFKQCLDKAAHRVTPEVDRHDQQGFTSLGSAVLPGKESQHCTSCLCFCPAVESINREPYPETAALFF
ncbi:uncharacterized protein LOC106631212 [Falco cherrug]|uniref:uncharacterized protein LOC106631212 n=1 Tax=Falco cherrug TaxID=345164 RepID=UPI002479E98D|nr:uncharacterized protein LOC106631212 [Falco cherrug]